MQTMRQKLELRGLGDLVAFHEHGLQIRLAGDSTPRGNSLPNGSGRALSGPGTATPAAPETIGECDVCGLVDHHLRFGLCPQCSVKYRQAPSV